MVVAADLQLSGPISVLGGRGGSGGSFEQGAYAAQGGAHGPPGCIKLLADTLRVPSPTLPVIGPTVIGRPDPRTGMSPSVRAFYLSRQSQ